MDNDTLMRLNGKAEQNEIEMQPEDEICTFKNDQKDLRTAIVGHCNGKREAKKDKKRSTFSKSTSDQKQRPNGMAVKCENEHTKLRSKIAQIEKENETMKQVSKLLNSILQGRRSDAI